MNEQSILTHIDDQGIATLTMNRPELRNAFDDAVISALTVELKRLEADPRVRVVCLAANGNCFSAGADLGWMRRMAEYTRDQNLADAHGLAGLMRTLDTISRPTIALVQGDAYGGGVGLVACCDIALAVRNSRFCLSEVRLGLIPAVISPYLIVSIGSRACRRYFQTAESFSAEQACLMGLVHEVVEDSEQLQKRGRTLAEQLLNNGPAAMAEAKRLVADLAGRAPDDALMAETAERIATRRASPEGREGVSAFLEKRTPAWIARNRS